MKYRIQRLIRDLISGFQRAHWVDVFRLISVQTPPGVCTQATFGLHVPVMTDKIRRKKGYKFLLKRNERSYSKSSNGSTPALNA